MKKKLTATLLSVVMSAALIAGCGAQRQVNTEKAVENQKEEKTKLTFMAVGGSNEKAFTNVIEEAAKKFNANNEYNAEIELEWYENEQYKVKLATLMTQDDVTDIFFTWEAGFMKDYVETGKVASLSGALSNDSEWSERFNPGVFSAVTFDNEIYAVPMGQAIIPVYYNKALFADHNVKVPATWDDFMGTVKTFKDAGIVPVSMATKDAWVSAQMMLELSGGIGSPELFGDIVSGKAAWNDERYIETGRVFQELVQAGAFPEGFLGLSYDEGRGLFTSGKAAMYPMGTWDTSAIIGEMGDEANIGVFLLPAKNPEFNDTHIASVEKLFAVSEKCDNKEAAIAFLKILSDSDIQEKYMVDCGSLLATKLEVDASKVDSVTAEIAKLQKNITNTLTPMDRQFGANIGGEFNNISLAIVAGSDPKEQFTFLKDYADRQLK